MSKFAKCLPMCFCKRGNTFANLDQCIGNNLQGRLNVMCQKRDKQPKFLRNVICKNLTKHI